MGCCSGGEKVKRAQASVEAMFMVAISSVIILLVILKLLSPQTGIAKHTASTACATQKSADSNLTSMLNGTKGS